MKVNKIKNRGRTGAKVLLFCILAVTLGLANACRSGGNDDTITDAEAVQRAKENLAIIYAGGDSRTSVTQDVRLPATGENGVDIAWESDNSSVINLPPPPPPPLDSEPITGTVIRPGDVNTEVTLTATLTKNDASDERTFTLTVILLSCETSGLVARLQAMPPSLRGCSASSIRGADMPALVSAGVTKEQLLTVWSADADMGFTPAQLKEASVTIAEMRSHGLTIAQLRTGGIADYLVFNEACMPLSSKTCSYFGVSQECSTNYPTITLTSTSLSTDMQPVVLRGRGAGSVTWASDELMGAGNVISFSLTSEILEETLGKATGRRVSDGVTDPVVSTLSIPLADVFSNPTVNMNDRVLRTTSTQLCPGM